MHALHENSVASFRDLDVSKREALILACYRLASVPLTDREVAERLGFSEMNAVRPRITHLLEREMLYESRSVKCTVTGKSVRTCGPTSLF